MPGTVLLPLHAGRHLLMLGQPACQSPITGELIKLCNTQLTCQHVACAIGEGRAGRRAAVGKTARSEALRCHTAADTNLASVEHSWALFHMQI